MISAQKAPFLIIAALFFSIAGLLSCNGNRVYEAEKKISNDLWSYTDTLDFQIPVQDTSQLYNLYIHLTHADTFPNQNLYLKLYTRFPDGKRVSRVRSFDLYDTEGKSVGDCSGATCETKILLQDKLYFNQIGDYLLTLEQYSRSNPLGGLSAVGLSLEKAEKKK